MIDQTRLVNSKLLSIFCEFNISSFEIEKHTDNSFLSVNILALIWEHTVEAFLFVFTAGDHSCLTDKNCPHYSKCVKNKCTCRFELTGDGETCKAGTGVVHWL